MSPKIVQFQINTDLFADKAIDVAADWVYDKSSDMYKKYKNLRKEDFLALMKAEGDEQNLTKKQLFPCGVALTDKGKFLPIVVDHSDELVLVDELDGYLGVNLTRDQLVAAIMAEMKML